MIRKRTFKEFDLGQVRLPDNQASTEYNSQSVTNSPAAIPSPGGIGSESGCFPKSAWVPKRTSIS
jgi:hypothetical protein